MQLYGCILWVQTEGVLHVPGRIQGTRNQTRRHLLDKLREQDGLTLAELCTELDMSRQAVSKHLAILESAILVATVQKGRSKYHYLNPVPLQDIVDRWVAPYRRHQTEALTTLKRKLEKKP